MVFECSIQELVQNDAIGMCCELHTLSIMYMTFGWDKCNMTKQEMEIEKGYCLINSHCSFTMDIIIQLKIEDCKIGTIFKFDIMTYI